jgi:anthraniloyl-CoA monooxygenase
MQVHGYPYSETGSTFIVEMHEDVWRRAGFDDTEETEFPPGASDERAVARPRALRRRTRRPPGVRQQLEVAQLHHRTQRAAHDGNLVLVGDAAHTAHFSIGSGTKLAMEDALALAACLHEHPDIERR